MLFNLLSGESLLWKIIGKNIGTGRSVSAGTGAFCKITDKWIRFAISQYACYNESYTGKMPYYKGRC